MFDPHFSKPEIREIPVFDSGAFAATLLRRSFQTSEQIQLLDRKSVQIFIASFAVRRNAFYAAKSIIEIARSGNEARSFLSEVISGTSIRSATYTNSQSYAVHPEASASSSTRIEWTSYSRPNTVSSALAIETLASSKDIEFRRKYTVNIFRISDLQSHGTAHSESFAKTSSANGV